MESSTLIQLLADNGTLNATAPTFLVQISCWFWHPECPLLFMSREWTGKWAGAEKARQRVTFIRFDSFWTLLWMGNVINSLIIFTRSAVAAAKVSYESLVQDSWIVSTNSKVSLGTICLRYFVLLEWVGKTVAVQINLGDLIEWDIYICVLNTYFIYLSACSDLKPIDNYTVLRNGLTEISGCV